MPSWKPVAVVAVLAAAGLWIAFPDYLDLQTAASPDVFLGVLGDDTARATVAALMDVVFVLAYVTIFIIAFDAVTAGVTRLVGFALAAGSGVADQVENAMVMLNVRSGSDLEQSGIDLMLTAGSVKWALLAASIILLLALAGQRWIDERRA